MATTARLLTYDDLCRMPDDGQRYELIGGEIVVSASPSRYHQSVEIRLSATLYNFVTERDLGWVFSAPFDVAFTPHDVVEPDLLFVRKEREHIIRDHFVEGAPDLIVEILSPSTRGRDLCVKLQLYAAFGVPEYWLPDPIAKTFRLYVLRNGTYELIEPSGRILRSEILPGLEIDLEALFAKLR